MAFLRFERATGFCRVAEMLSAVLARFSYIQSRKKATVEFVFLSLPQIFQHQTALHSTPSRKTGMETTSRQWKMVRFGFRITSAEYSSPTIEHIRTAT